MSTLPYPMLADWVITSAKRSENSLVQLCQENLKSALTLSQSLPDMYNWETISPETFKTNVTQTNNIHCFNYEFWRDWSKNCDAYSVMLYWRAIEIINPVTRAINQKDYVAAAILARSLLELVSSYLLNANFILRAVKDAVQVSEQLAVCPECEEFIVKAIWGRRFLEPGNAHKQINALTHVQRLSKSPNAELLWPMYEFLCEVAHPNVVGYARFWQDEAADLPSGAQIREISRQASGSVQQELLNNTLWALSFGAAGIKNSYRLINDALSDLMPWIEREGNLCRVQSKSAAT